MSCFSIYHMEGKKLSPYKMVVDKKAVTETVVENGTSTDYNTEEATTSTIYKSYTEEGREAMSWASSSFGDINGDGYTELVVAGRKVAKGNADGASKIRVMAFTYNHNKNTVEILAEESTLDAGSGSWNMYDDVSAGDRVPAVTVECAALGGTGVSEMVFVDGVLLKFNGSQFSKEYGFGLNNIDWDDHKSGTGSNDKYETWIDSAYVGNYNGNAYGQEQIYVSYSTKTEKKVNDRYAYSFTQFVLKNDTPGSSGDSAKYGYDKHDKCSLVTSNLWEEDGGNGAQGLYYNFLPVDYDSDGQMAEFEGKDVTYSDPEVLAVLQSPPYFEEVSRYIDGNYPKNGETAFGKSSGKTTSASVSSSITAGISTGFEQEISVFGVKLAGIEYETSLETSFTYEYEHEKEVTTEVEYSQPVGEGNAVVVFTTPYINYHYNVWVPEQIVPSDSDEFETWLTDAYTGEGEGNTAYASMSSRQKTAFKAELAEQGVKPGAVIKGHYDTMTVSAPKEAVTTMINTESYDEIAAKTKGLDIIEGNIMKNQVGEPASYDTKYGNFTTVGSKKGVGHSGGLIVNSKEIATTNSNSFTFETSTNTTVGVEAGGTKVSASIGFGFGTGATVANMSGVTYTGSVDGLPKSAARYNFDWIFGQGTATINGNETPVLQYYVTDVIQPVKVPDNFQIVEANIEDVKVCWDKSSDADKYILYIYNKNTQEYEVVDTVDGRTTEYTFTNLLTGCKYNFGICAANNNEKSAMSILTDTTMPANALYVTITDELDDVSATPGGEAVFTCDAYYKWNNATGANASKEYIWQKWDMEKGSWITLATTKTPSYAMKDVKIADEGTQIRCKVSFSYGTIYVYSRTASIHINPFKTNTTVSIAGTYGENECVPEYSVEEKVNTAEVVTVNQTLAATVGDKTDNYEIYETADGTTVYKLDGKYYLLTAAADKAGTYTRTECTKAGRGNYLGNITNIDTDKFVNMSATESVTPTVKADGFTYTGAVTLYASQSTAADTVYIGYYTLDSDKQICYVVKSGTAYTAYDGLDYEEDYITVNAGKVNISDLTAKTQTQRNKSYTTTTKAKEGTKLTISAKVTAEGMDKGEYPFGDVTFTFRNIDTQTTSTAAGLLKDGKTSITWTSKEAGTYEVTANYHGVLAEYSGYGVAISGSKSAADTLVSGGVKVSIYDEDDTLLTKQYTHKGGTVDYLTENDNVDGHYAYYLDNERIYPDTYKFTKDTKLVAKVQTLSKDENGYYEIYTPMELQTYIDIVNKGENQVDGLDPSCKLMRDMDFYGYEYETIIGKNPDNGFSGTFDGNYHEIKNLNIETSQQGAMFKNINTQGVIKNIKAEGNILVNVPDVTTAAVVLHNFGKIENCIFNYNFDAEFSSNYYALEYSARGSSSLSNVFVNGTCEGKLLDRSIGAFYSGNKCTNTYIATQNDNSHTGIDKVTDSQIRSGEVAYKLNNGETDSTKIIFGQNLNADDDNQIPEFKTSDNEVYHITIKDESETGTTLADVYTNAGSKLGDYTADMIASTNTEGKVYKFYNGSSQIRDGDVLLSGMTIIRKFEEVEKDTEGYYLISNVDEYNAVARRDNATDKIKLTADLDFEGQTIQQISTTNPFAGVFDGQEHTMSNITSCNPLFNRIYKIAYQTDAVRIENLNIENVNIAKSADSVNKTSGGIIASSISNSAYLHNAKLELLNIHILSGSLSGFINYEGAFFASAYDAKITVKNCSNNADVSSKTAWIMGGMFGSIGQLIRGNSPSGIDLILDNVVNTGDVKKDGSNNGCYIGGIAGTIAGQYGGGVKCPMNNCRNYGKVSVDESDDLAYHISMGGLAGHIAKVKVTNCQNMGDIQSESAAKYQIIGGCFGNALDNSVDMNNITNYGTISYTGSEKTDYDPDYASHLESWTYDSRDRRSIGGVIGGAASSSYTDQLSVSTYTGLVNYGDVIANSVSYMNMAGGVIGSVKNDHETSISKAGNFTISDSANYGTVSANTYCSVDRPYMEEGVGGIVGGIYHELHMLESQTATYNYNLSLDMNLNNCMNAGFLENVASKGNAEVHELGPNKSINVTNQKVKLSTYYTNIATLNITGITKSSYTNCFTAKKVTSEGVTQMTEDNLSDGTILHAINEGKEMAVLMKYPIELVLRNYGVGLVNIALAESGFEKTLCPRTR